MERVSIRPADGCEGCGIAYDATRQEKKVASCGRPLDHFFPQCGQFSALKKGVIEWPF